MPPGNPAGRPGAGVRYPQALILPLLRHLQTHPGGTHAAFTVDVGPNPSQPRYDVLVARLDGDTAATPFATGDADELAAPFSPDGRWLAYASDGDRLFYRTDDALMVAELRVGNERLEVTSRGQLFQAELLGGSGYWTATYDVHPQEDKFVVARGVSGSGGDVVVWTDWIHELRPLLGLDR